MKNKSDNPDKRIICEIHATMVEGGGINIKIISHINGISPASLLSMAIDEEIRQGFRRQPQEDRVSAEQRFDPPRPVR